MNREDFVVFSFIKCTSGSVIPSARIALFLQEQFEARLATGSPVIGDPSIGTPRVLILVGGAYAFLKEGVHEDLGRAIREAERVIWVQNDYTVIPPRTEGDAKSPFRRAFVERTEAGKPPPDYWTTCQKWAGLTALSRYVNWNALCFEPRDPPAKREHGDRLLYYGAFRDTGGRTSRKKYFDRYFTEPQIPVTISTTERPGFPNKFRLMYQDPHIKHLRKFEGDLVSQISQYGAGLYLEDIASHSEFHSPANRFYEMLSAGLPIIFQPECGEMMRRAGINPEPFSARNSREVKRMFERRAQIGEEQHDLWGKIDHRGKMIFQFQGARKDLEAVL